MSDSHDSLQSEGTKSTTSMPVGELRSVLLQMNPAQMDIMLGQQVANRFRTEDETVRDLIIAAICLGVDPIEMWPADPTLHPY